ncbi:hypothetical protein C8R46DRAFT_1185926 [Mycena filopes]|nr:hypothetical protein C8R46DRAFT_1185926 [Mycena filopes]
MPSRHKKASSRASPTASDRQELETREKSAEIYKNTGNDFFRQGRYQEAAYSYNRAVEVNGTQPVYMSNLAATYLKLEDYELAEKAAGMALLHDPRMKKARFRRGVARKESNKFRAAIADFETILRDDPTCAEAITELAAVKQVFESNGEDDVSGAGDYAFPVPDQRPQDPLPLYLLTEDQKDESSEEEDLAEHVGNGIPCKHHNLKPLGCAKGKSCVYSHAPDARSFPDSEGRNVCLYFLLGSCKFGSRCLYSHSKANLPKLWEDESQLPYVRDEIIRGNEEMIKERRLFENYMGKGPEASPILLALKRATDEARERKAHAAGTAKGELDPSSSSGPFILHLTLNKSTQIPRDTVSNLRDVIDVSRAKSKTKALSLLSSPQIVGVLITDAGILHGKNADMLARLVAYAKNRGVVVIGGSFRTFEGNKPTDVTPTQLEAFFRQSWGLPWKMGARRRADLTLNTHHKRAEETLAASNPLPKTWKIREAQHLKGVRADAALYISTGHSQLDPTGFRASGLTETPVAFAEIGKGHLGFVGDLGAENATADVILAMFGLSKA